MTDQTAPRPITDLSLAELRARIAEAATFASRAVAYGKEAQEEIARRLAADAANAMKAKNKESGETTIEADGEKYKVEISKTVSYDSDKLLTVAGSMDWPTAQKIFKFALSVPEAIFKSAEATNPDLFKQLQQARTVKYGELTIKPIFDKK